MAALFVWICDVGRERGSMFALPWLDWSLAWGLTAETGDRGEVTAELPLLDVAC
jgi:hypothetical protein